MSWTPLQGDVDYAVVTSPCDNVVHSLLNTSRFSGTFLPGFLPIKDDIEDSSSSEPNYVRNGRPSMFLFQKNYFLNMDVFNDILPFSWCVTQSWAKLLSELLK